MANLDTRSKRASSVALATAFVLAPPLPDGTIDQGDRQHIAYSYSGIPASPFVPPVDTGQGDSSIQMTSIVESSIQRTSIPHSSIGSSFGFWLANLGGRRVRLSP